MPLASIIITTYDRPHLLRRAIASARSASDRDIEIIVVDDGGKKPDAKRVCSSAGNIKYIRNEVNSGVAGARNRGIQESCGEYLSFLDDDDIRFAGSLDAQIDALAAAPEAGFSYGQAILGREDGSPSDVCYPSPCPEGDVFWQLMAQNFVPSGATVFRRKCLARVGGLEPALAGIDDWDLWIRIAEFYPVIAETQPVMIWRKSTPVSGQGTSDAVRIAGLSTRSLRERWLKLARAKQSSAGKRREIKRRFSLNMARHLLWEAGRSVAARKPRRAAQDVIAAICLCPTGVARTLASPRSFQYLLMQRAKRKQLMKGEMKCTN